MKPRLDGPWRIAPAVFAGVYAVVRGPTVLASLAGGVAAPFLVAVVGLGVLAALLAATASIVRPAAAPWALALLAVAIVVEVWSEALVHGTRAPTSSLAITAAVFAAWIALSRFTAPRGSGGV